MVLSGVSEPSEVSFKNVTPPGPLSEHTHLVFQGVGWWKYEFCYGKHVHQYHEVKLPLLRCYLIRIYVTVLVGFKVAPKKK